MLKSCHLSPLKHGWQVDILRGNWNNTRGHHKKYFTAISKILAIKKTCNIVKYHAGDQSCVGFGQNSYYALCWGFLAHFCCRIEDLLCPKYDSNMGDLIRRRHFIGTHEKPICRCDRQCRLYIPWVSVSLKFLESIFIVSKNCPFFFLVIR